MPPQSAEALAKTWIEYWNQSKPDEIPLDENFTHTSPYGTITGRETYLNWVKPLAALNVTQLNILRIIADDNQAVVHFQMNTPIKPIQACDWITTKDGKITEIHSFYDATNLPAPPTANK
jgi:hypothetical protein